jgi:MFS family permease
LDVSPGGCLERDERLIRNVDVITQLPSNLIITKVRPSWYICCVTSAWGIVSMSQAFSKNYGGLMALRFILGLVEAPFLPGVFFLMSCYYKRSELPPRMAILYGSNMLASSFGGLIAAGIISQMEGKAGRPAWVSSRPPTRSMSALLRPV